MAIGPSYLKVPFKVMTVTWKVSHSVEVGGWGIFFSDFIVTKMER